jgi:DNA-binding transcriptional ArsR family regulator
MSSARLTVEADAHTDAVLRALGDGQRRRILRLVQSEELAAGQIAVHFDLTQQAVSHHIHVLRRAGLVRERRDGARRLYALDPEAMKPVQQILSEFWPAALDRLKHVVEQDQASKQGATRKRPGE